MTNAPVTPGVGEPRPAPPRPGRSRPLAAVGVAVIASLALAGLGLVSGTLGVTSQGASRMKPGAEVAVTAMDTTRKPSNNSPLLVADPTDERIVVMANRLDAPDFGCALHLSGDGGRSWVPTDPVPKLPEGAEKCYAPEVAFDRAGALHYLFVGLQGGGNEPMGAFLATSVDKGRHFGPPRRVLGPLNFGVRMVIDRDMGKQGRMHLVWLHATSDPPLGGFADVPNPILAAHSDDGGATFSEPVPVSDAARRRVVAPALTLGANHAVHVAYYDLQKDARDYQGLDGPVWEGTWGVVVSTSADGGRRFSPGVDVDDAVAPPERPMLIFTMAPPALAATETTLCSAWTDARSGDADVVARCSHDLGRHWGALRRLNDDAVGNGARQYLPRLSAAPGGRIDAVFLDRRHDPNNAANDVAYTSSSDGGRHFTPTARLSVASSSGQIGQRYVGPAAEGQFEIGGRLGLLSRRWDILAAWPDTRNSRPGTAQDVVVRPVELAHRTQPGWARLLGAALLAAATLGVAATATSRSRLRRSRSGQGEAGQVQAIPAEPGPGAPTTRRWARHALAIAVVGAVGAAVVMRAAGSDGSAPILALLPPTVDVTMSEYRFAFRPPAATGRVVFRVRNAGQERHVFGLYPLPDDLPPIDVQLKGTKRRNVQPVAELALPTPGQVRTVAVDLVPGRRYALLCFLVTSPNKENHALLGMNAEFRAGRAPVARQPAAPGAK